MDKPSSTSRLSDADFIRKVAADYEYVNAASPVYDRLMQIANTLPSESGEDWQARAIAAEAKLADAQREIKSLQGFADLWYFAMDHAPGDFERIVTTCSPAHWMHEIAKIKRGEA